MFLASHKVVVPGFRILAASAVQVTHTGNTNETALATITVPAGAMGPNGGIRGTFVASRAGGTAGVITVRVRFSTISGTVFANPTLSTAPQESLRHYFEFWNRNSASSQISGASGNAFASVTGAEVTSAVNTTAATTIVFSGQLGDGNDTVGLEQYVVEIFQKA